MSIPTRWLLPPQAKLRAFGIEAGLDDQIEGGTVAVEGEPGVIVEVPAVDAEDARRILSDSDGPEQQTTN